MFKIGIVGAPSSGKTTVAQRTAADLRYHTNKRVELVDETARWFVAKHGVPTIYDQFLIATLQLQKETASYINADITVTDSPAFLSLVYSFRVMDCAASDYSKQVTYLHELQKMLAGNLHSYDRLIYFPPIATETNDGMRVHTDPGVIAEIDQEILAFMRLHKIQFEQPTEGIDTLNGRVQYILEGMLHG